MFTRSCLWDCPVQAHFSSHFHTPFLNGTKYAYEITMLRTLTFQVLNHLTDFHKFGMVVVLFEATSNSYF
jgi:hypothetical protein